MAPAAGVSGEAVLACAGRADLAFAAAELIVRDGRRIERRRLSAAQLLASPDPRIATLVDRIQRPREPFAGLVLDRPLIMGIVNVTPDSFSDGSLYLDPNAAVAHALRLDAEGADILDIGGESTRPGAAPVDVDEECRRVVPVIEELAKRSLACISIDTRNGEVMRRAALAGAHIINDVSALTTAPDSLAAAADTRLWVVLMHMLGEPRTMQASPTYADVVLDVYDALEARIDACEAAGIRRERLAVDPGIGFGKTVVHNLALLNSLSILHGLGCAVLVGTSRKSFISRLTGAGPNDRLPGSLATALTAVAQGVQIVRVHDVAATAQAIALWEGVHGPSPATGQVV